MPRTNWFAMSMNPSVSAPTQSASLRWLWHLCGALGILYFLLFWICVFTPLGNKIPATSDQAVLANLVALVLSLLGATLASKRWYLATGVLALNLLFNMYASRV